MPKSKLVVAAGRIEQSILLISGEKVIIDADLAEYTASRPTALTGPSVIEPFRSLLFPDTIREIGRTHEAAGSAGMVVWLARRGVQT